MLDTQWYENYANKIKAKTWKTSDRFTEMDRLDLNISNKLANAKPKLAKLINDPVAMYSLSPNVKRIIAVLRKYSPSLFKEVQPYIKPKTPTETAMGQAQKKALQGEMYGEVEEGAMDKLVKYGAIPEMRNKTFWERTKTGAAFPLQKLLSVLNIFPRTEAALTSQAYRKATESGEYPKISDFKLSNYDVAAQAKKNINPLNALKLLDIGKEGWEKVGKAALDIGEYKGKYFADVYKEMLPNTRFTKPYEWAKDQNDWVKGTNWLQKLASAVAGSPADITGLASDIAFDPLTYISGGAIKGMKVPDIGSDIVIKGGKTFVPKGSTVVLTKAGKELVEGSAGKVAKTITKNFADEIADIGTDIGKKAFIDKKVAETIIKSSAKNWTEGMASKYLDIGGLKYMGQTVVPGYKLQQKFGKSMQKVADIPFLKPINKIFNPYYGVPEALRPTKAYTESLMRSIYGQDMSDVMKALDSLSGAEQKTLNTFMIAERDIAKLTNKIDDVTAKFQKATSEQLFETGRDVRLKGLITGYENKITKLDDIIKNLDITPKVVEAKPKISEILENMFQRESKYIDYDKLQKYFPSIAKKEKFPFKTSALGAEEAFFQKAQTQDLIKMMKKGIEPEDLITSLSRRAKAGTQQIGRAENLDLVKQFGSKTPGAGLDELVDMAGKPIKELKGWYFPTEYKNTFARAYQTFFGDDAVNQVLKVHDRILTFWKRWALATPGFHMRNFWSDCFSGYMEYGFDFFKPRIWKQAYDVNVLKKSIRIGDNIFSPDDLAKAGVTTGTQYATEGMARSGKIASTIEKASPAYWSMRAGNVRESLGRTVAGVIELEKGSSLIDAAFNVKKVFFDYLSLTAPEVNIGKRVVPFYTWLRKNIQRQVELLFTRTGRYATVPKSLKYLENVAETRYGKEKMEEYKANMPDYYKDLGATITAMTNKEGQPLVLNPNLPFQDWARMSPNDLATSISPLLKMPIELMTNEDLFFKTIIDRSREGQGNYRETPKWLSIIAGRLPNDILKYMGMEKSNGKVFMTDLTSYFMRQLPPLYVLQRVLPAEQTPKTPLDWLSLGAGIKFFNFDIEKEKKNKLNQFINEINTELSKRKQTGEQILDTGQIEKAYKQIYADYMAKKYPNAAIANHMGDITKYAGSTGEIDLMVKMMRKPYEDAMKEIQGKTLPELAKILSGLGINPTMEEVNTIINQLNARDQERG